MANSQLAFTIFADDDEARAKLEKFAADYEGSIKRVDKATQKTGAATKAMMNAFTGAVSAATAAVGIMMQEMERQAEDKLEAVRQKAASIRQFAQIPQGGKAASEQNLKLERELATGRGIQREVARQFVFDLSSQQLTPEQIRQSFDLAELDPTSASGIAAGAASLQKGFGAEAGSYRASINKILTAAGGSAVKAAEFAPALGKVSPVASMIGAGDEETMAALASLGQVAGNEQAGTQLRAFVMKAADIARTQGVEFKGGLLDTAKQIKSMGLESELSENSLVAYQQLLARGEDITGRQADITRAERTTGTERDTARRQVQIAYELGGPTMLAELEQRKAENRLHYAKADDLNEDAAREALQNASAANLEASVLEKGGGRFAQTAARTVGKLTDWGDDTVGNVEGTANLIVNPMQAARNATQNLGFNVLGAGNAERGANLAARLVDALERNTAATERNSASTETGTTAGAETGNRY